MASEPLPKAARESLVVMTQIVLPPDTNALNTAFGGRVMEWIDQCGAICAQRHCRQTVVTASSDDLHFHAPIRAGWIVILKARVLAVFHSSVEVGVLVIAEDPLTGEQHLTTSALLTCVALGQAGQKAKVPPLLIESEEERQVMEEAKARRAERLARKNKGQSWQKLLLF